MGQLVSVILISPAAMGTARWQALGFTTLAQGTVSVKPLEKQQVHVWYFGDTFSVARAFPRSGLSRSPRLLWEGLPSSPPRSTGTAETRCQGRGAGRVERGSRTSRRLN